MDNSELIRLRDKIESTQRKKMNKARKYMTNKLRNSMKQGNTILGITENKLKYWFGLSFEQIEVIMSEFKKLGWVINYKYNNRKKYIFKVTDKVFSQLPIKLSNDELLKQAKKEIETLKKEMALLPGGAEYLSAQSRFNENVGKILIS